MPLCVSGVIPALVKDQAVILIFPTDPIVLAVAVGICTAFVTTAAWARRVHSRIAVD